MDGMGMDFGGWTSPQGVGWTAIPGVVTDSNGTVAGGIGATGDFAASGNGTAAYLAGAVMHPTARQVLFFGAVVLLAFAWRGHLKSMLE
jgi:hypothetical protein